MMRLDPGGPQAQWLIEAGMDRGLVQRARVIRMPLQFGNAITLPGPGGPYIMLRGGLDWTRAAHRARMVHEF